MTACPDCGLVFASNDAMEAHRAIEHPDELDADDDLDYDEAEHEEAWSRVYEQPVPDPPPFEYRPTWSDRIFDGFGWLWSIGKFLVGLFIVVAIVLGILGVFDKEPVTEDSDDPGYALVRQLQSDGVIEEFRAVEPEKGWDWEYELDDVTLQLRVDGNAIESQVEYSTTDEELADTISEELDAYKFRR